MLTGEPVPVEVGPGDDVAGGTVNTFGRLLVRATRVGSETAIAQIARLVEEAQAGKAPFSGSSTGSPPSSSRSCWRSPAALVGWLALTGDPTDAFTASVAVLIIACPCALGLATPTALMVGTGRGAQLGIVIKGPEVLERTRRITTIVLDKTGTVTEGRMWLETVIPAEGVSRAELLRSPGRRGRERAPDRPSDRRRRARRSRCTASRRALHQPRRTGRRSGRRGTRDGRRPARAADRAGYRRPARADGGAIGGGGRGTNSRCRRLGRRRSGMLVVADRVKPTSADAVAELAGLDLTPILLTGDNRRTARSVADAVGIERVLADVLPEDKVAEVARLQEAERSSPWSATASATPALVQADLGLAIGTGTDVAIEASDLTLVSGDLRAAADAIRLHRRTLRTIEGTSSGRSPTTSRRSRSRRRPAEPDRRGRWRARACSSSPTACGCGAFAAVVKPRRERPNDAWLRLGEGCADQATAPHRGPGARHRADGRGRAVLHRHPHQIAAVSTALDVSVKLLEDHVRHCVADALAAGDAEVAEQKSEDLLAAVQRFSRTLGGLGRVVVVEPVRRELDRPLERAVVGGVESRSTGRRSRRRRPRGSEARRT